jgi:D-alanyl-D-alanine dipeptidase
MHLLPKLSLILVASLSFAALNPLPLSAKPALPTGFVYARSFIPDLILDMRYAGAHNFVGKRIAGYRKPVCILTEEAAKALARVQAQLKAFGLGLEVFDCYRPQTAVNQFIAWANDLGDIRMKGEFYPEVPKKDLFKEDYIASRSSHTRGSTVDITLVGFDPDGNLTRIDMGTGFDLFSRKSWPDSRKVNGNQRAHRMLLHVLMKRAGFVPYPREWWHFTLAKEPFPDTYFDFPVE